MFVWPRRAWGGGKPLLVVLLRDKNHNRLESSPGACGVVEDSGMNKFQKQIEKCLQELRQLKGAYDVLLRRYLEQQATWLASLSEDYLRMLIEQARKEHLALERDIRKAVALGRGTMPQHIYRTQAISVHTWVKLPPGARKVLEKPTNTVQIRNRSKLQNVSVGDLPRLSEGRVRQVLSANYPKRGILHPDDDQSRWKRPAYFTLESASAIGQQVMLTSVMAETYHRTATTVAELEAILKAVQQGSSWKRS